MTNIRTEGFFPTLEELGRVHAHPSRQSIKELFDLRISTYVQFANIEKDKGFLQPTMSLSTPDGQEAIRILIQRGLEEMVEAYDSHDHDHYLEELIDAVNYFWVMAILDSNCPLGKVIEGMTDVLMNHVHDHNRDRINLSTLGNMLVGMNPILEKLRHRAWMKGVQSPYFDGWPEITTFLADHLCLVWDQFNSWTEFVQFFIAKDRVLQFRIRTNY